MNDRISRRDFLKHGSVGSVCLAAAGSAEGSAARASAPGRIGPNDTLYDKKNAVIKKVSGNATTDRANTLSSTGPALDRLHVRDFVDAIRTGKAPNCPVEEGHKSVALLHLGNIAWRVQRELNCRPQDGHILNDPEAAKLWRRDYEPGWEPIV